LELAAKCSGSEATGRILLWASSTVKMQKIACQRIALSYSISLSSRNGNMKMSLNERKDIRVESEGNATSECDFQVPTDALWRVPELTNCSRSASVAFGA